MSLLRSSPLAALILATGAAAQVRVTYLANEGFVLRGGGKAVVIDAIFGEGIPGYPRVPAELRGPLEKATGVFAGVDLVLATHVHGDHFDAEAVARHLRANPKAHFVSTPQAVAKLRAELGGAERLLARVRAVLPAEGKRERLQVNGITLEALQLTHGRRRVPPVQNVAFLISLGGTRLLHIGDSEATGADVRRYALAKDRIDVALLPCWYLNNDRWKGIVDTAIAARHLVLMHLPSRSAPKAYFGPHGSYDRYVGAVRERYPRAILFEKAGQSRTFGAPARARADAAALLNAARQRATQEKKRILVHTGGAGWGRRLDALLATPAVAELLAQRFVIVKIDERVANGELVGALLRGGRRGMPWLAILAPDLERLAVSDIGHDNVAFLGSVRAAEKLASQIAGFGFSTAERERLAEAARQHVKRYEGKSIGRGSAPPAGAAVFPDKTWLPALNGVKDPPGPCPWPKGTPYAPVVAVRKGAQGLWWYVHGDGAVSTTRIVPMRGGGPGRASWMVGNPQRKRPRDR